MHRHQPLMQASTRPAPRLSSIALAAVTSLALSLAACAPATPAAPAQAPAKPTTEQAAAPAGKAVRVRLAELYQIHGAQMFDPLFPERAKKYGLDVEVVPMKRYPEVQTALATGEVEFGAFGFSNVGAMAENNIRNVKLIAGNSTGGQGLVLRKGLNDKVKAWKDLEGLRIGVASGGAAFHIFRTLVKAKGVDLDKIQQVNFATMGPEALQALKSGEVDGILSWEPTSARAVVGGFGEYSTLLLEESETGNINGALAVTTDFASKNPEAVVNMLKTLVETTDYLRGNPDEWVKLAAAKTGVEPEVVRESLKHMKIQIEMPAPRVRAFMDAMATFGATKANYRSEVDTYLDYSYLEKATGKSKKELGAE